MKVIRDGLYLCSDCIVVACNGEEGAELYNRDATLQGIAELGFHLVPDFDSETGKGIHEFSSRECAACKTTLAGYRAEFAILGDE